MSHRKDRSSQKYLDAVSVNTSRRIAKMLQISDEDRMSLTMAISDDDVGSALCSAAAVTVGGGGDGGCASATATQPSADPVASTFNCAGAVRKAGYLSVKKWLLRKRHQVELARRRGWKGYWVCLKGTTLLFYPCESEQGRSIERSPKHLIIVDGAIMQPIPEHPKRDNIFCLSTAFGDAYLFQAPCNVELVGWIHSIHTACAAAFARHRGKTGTLHLLQEDVLRLQRSIDSESKLKYMCELQFGLSDGAADKRSVASQIAAHDDSLERLNCELFRLKCYMCSLQSGELPNPKSLLTRVSRATKLTLNRLGVFAVSSLHAYTCARSPSLLNNLLAGRGATKRRAPMLDSTVSGGNTRKIYMSETAPDEADSGTGPRRSYRVKLPDHQYVSITLRDAMTVEDFLVSACVRRDLNPSEHFLRVKKHNNLPTSSCFVPLRTDHILTYLQTHEVCEVCDKRLYQTELTRSSLDQLWGFSVEAELLENTQRQDELCCYVSRVEEHSLASINGLIRGDEIIVINGAIVADLDMMYIESLLQDELQLCIMARTCRAEVPASSCLAQSTDELIERLVCPPPPPSDTPLLDAAIATTATTHTDTISRSCLSSLIVPNVKSWETMSAKCEEPADTPVTSEAVSDRSQTSADVESLPRRATPSEEVCVSPVGMLATDSSASSVISVQSLGCSNSQTAATTTITMATTTASSVAAASFDRSLAELRSEAQDSDVNLEKVTISDVSGRRTVECDSQEASDADVVRVSKFSHTQAVTETLSDDAKCALVTTIRSNAQDGHGSTQLENVSDIEAVRDCQPLETIEVEKAQIPASSHHTDTHPVRSANLPSSDAVQQIKPDSSELEINKDEPKSNEESHEKSAEVADRLQPSTNTLTTASSSSGVSQTLPVQASSINPQQESVQSSNPQPSAHVAQVATLPAAHKSAIGRTSSTHKPGHREGTVRVRFAGEDGDIRDQQSAATGQLLSDADKLKMQLLELLLTERNYVQNLNCLMDNYLIPLRNESFVSESEMEALFGNIPNIVTFHRMFLDSLVRAIGSESRLQQLSSAADFKDVLFSVANTFLQHALNFKLYSAFCTSHSRAQKVLHPNEGNHQLRQFLQRQNPDQQHSCTLESYLITPIQRILKYPLILQQLKSLTDQQSGECYHLAEALTAMEKIAEYINEVQRIHEEYGAIFDHLSRQHEKSTNSILPINSTVDLSTGELLHYGGVEWLNIGEFLGKVKKNLELHSICFVFRTAVVLLCKEKLRQKKRLMGSGSKNNTSEVEIIRYQVLIPVTEVQVRSSTQKDSTTRYPWDLLHLKSQLHRRNEKTYHLSNSEPDFRHAFLRSIRLSIRDSVRSMSLPVSKSSSGSSGAASFHNTTLQPIRALSARRSADNCRPFTATATDLPRVSAQMTSSDRGDGASGANVPRSLPRLTSTTRNGSPPVSRLSNNH